jgi:hypothetical protein
MRSSSAMIVVNVQRTTKDVRAALATAMDDRRFAELTDDPRIVASALWTEFRFAQAQRSTNGMRVRRTRYPNPLSHARLRTLHFGAYGYRQVVKISGKDLVRFSEPA